ncbi:MAG: coenzyme F420-0:L-glutamate ligase, partial [Candidatus Hydrogenedentes bacterium]|nr:coenzyme F420-0:L-glutamate ligase [Candidatus Hydrogenedentota bacterium]
RTDKIRAGQRDVLAVLEEFLPPLHEGTVVAVTSKIVALCEGRVVSPEDADKGALIAQEADHYLPASANKYHVALTIKDSMLVASAGIDESNTDGYYVLWPECPQASANRIRAALCERAGCRRLGVILTDSRSVPLRWGVTGLCIAHSGFAAITDRIGAPDVFGRPLSMTRVNVADALAAAAVLVMGEADEQTPLAVIEDLPFVEFQDRDPTPEELACVRIDPEDDMFGALLAGVEWRKGGKPGPTA